MKKLLMTMLALAGLSAFAAPSWIYFYIDQLAGGYSDYTFDYATVQAGSDNLKINGEDWPLYANEDGLTTSEDYAGEFDSSYTGDLIFTLWKKVRTRSRISPTTPMRTGRTTHIPTWGKLAPKRCS